MPNLSNRNQCLQYLQAMEITVWVRRFVEPEAVTDSVAAQQELPVSSPAAENTAQTEAWETLIREVTQCTACTLHQTRTKTVFGVGDRQAACLLVGEAPGADEDAQGEPFVGRAGRLLNEMLRAIYLSRQQVYIANILKCRPPNNREPNYEEMRCCTPFLRRQINLLKPKLIVALGRIAAQYLLTSTTPIGQLRGKKFDYADTEIPLIPTYHPAYLLRSPQQKSTAWQDLQLIQRTLAENKK